MAVSDDICTYMYRQLIVLTYIYNSSMYVDDFQLRTRDMHEQHCDKLQGPLHDHITTTYGLHRDSILNTSKFFHITEVLVPDIMHDILEYMATI